MIALLKCLPKFKAFTNVALFSDSIKKWEFQGHKLFSPEQFTTIINNLEPNCTQPFVILDVRNAEEFTQYALPQSNIVLQFIRKMLNCQSSRFHSATSWKTK